jgi:hypothetical protein
LRSQKLKPGHLELSFAAAFSCNTPATSLLYLSIITMHALTRGVSVGVTLRAAGHKFERIGKAIPSNLGMQGLTLTAEQFAIVDRFLHSCTLADLQDIRRTSEGVQMLLWSAQKVRLQEIKDGVKLAETMAAFSDWLDGQNSRPAKVSEATSGLRLEAAYARLRAVKGHLLIAQRENAKITNVAAITRDDELVHAACALTLFAEVLESHDFIPFASPEFLQPLRHFFRDKSIARRDFAAIMGAITDRAVRSTFDSLLPADFRFQLIVEIEDLKEDGERQKIVEIHLKRLFENLEDRIRQIGNIERRFSCETTLCDWYRTSGRINLCEAMKLQALETARNFSILERQRAFSYIKDMGSRLAPGWASSKSF